MHEVLRLTPYHCDLNATELIWANEKNFIARENNEMTRSLLKHYFESEEKKLQLKYVKTV